MPDYFTARCPHCLRSIRVHSVSVLRLGSYSYHVQCDCGTVEVIDGASGEHIPETLKQDAEQRRLASEIAQRIDHDRRKLPSCRGKVVLKDARVRDPVQQPDGTWQVYQLDEHTQVLYEPESGFYLLHEMGRDQRKFRTVADIANHLCNR